MLVCYKCEQLSLYSVEKNDSTPSNISLWTLIFGKSYLSNLAFAWQWILTILLLEWKFDPEFIAIGKMWQSFRNVAVGWKYHNFCYVKVS